MKQSIKIILYSTLLSLPFVFCTNHMSERFNENAAIVKIIKTSVFTAKPEFDSFIPDSPLYYTGLDKTLEMDLGWYTKYFDEYGNILFKEDYRLDKSGNENAYRTTENIYYSEKEGKLSLVKIDEGVKIEKRYIWDESGLLLEIHSIANGNLFKKQKFSYNQNGQRITKEIFREDGLEESVTYTWGRISNGNDTIVKQIRNTIGKYIDEYDYTYSKSNKLVKSRRKYYQDNKLLIDYVTCFENYHNNIATRIITEGYYLADTTSKEFIDAGLYNQELFRSTTEKYLNDFGDIIKYTRYANDINENGEIIETLLNGFGPTYTCEYTYNERNDWISLLITDWTLDKIIVIREIKYLDYNK